MNPTLSQKKLKEKLKHIKKRCKRLGVIGIEDIGGIRLDIEEHLSELEYCLNEIEKDQKESKK